MKKIFIPLVLIIILVCSCAKKCNFNAPPKYNIPSDNVFVFQCENDEFYTVHFQDDAAYLYHGYEMYKLPRAISASGARYSDGVNEFWNKGDMAMITIGDKSFQNCGLVNPNERMIKDPAYYFWALSNDPLWSLTIFNNEIAVFFDKKNKVYRFPSAVLVDSEEGDKVYTAQSDDNTLKVVITKKNCYDKKSDQTFPYHVKLFLDGKVYNGCGTSPQ
ncbi:MAG: MliC family protein [Candidatus Celaenobacter antarcticus]|nr:MliC family protein [Candidatus Celaenobacter antarcticus]